MAQTNIRAALQTGADGQRIQVRVGRVWEATNRKNGTVLHTNVILMDDQGDHILVIVRNNQKNLFLPKLKENGVCNITNFKIVPGPLTYKSVDKDMAINFFYKTSIEQVENNDAIPNYIFELQPFDRVRARVGRVNNLIDVIGMVTSIGRLEKRTNGSEKIDVALLDNKNQKMIVTLWDEKAYQFHAGIEVGSQSAMFVAITGLLAKQFSGTNKRPVRADDKDTQQLAIKDVLELQIPPGKDVRCLCTATITEVLNGNGWMYNCCSTCARAVHPTDGIFSCNACNESTVTVTQRYRIVASIQDDTGTTTVTLFNKEAEQLTGIPIQKLLNELGEGSDIERIPAAVNNIVGKVCAFQIKITKYNITHGCEEYTVARVSESSSATPSTSGTVESGNKAKRLRME
ncbi:hypothetical protein DCAR_0729357 [Daucus carota subsp. sativus]|uniref:Uncharacterized protein n=1 Tax=Daucus carota subsp. sativus TaxID=79200 RepID=A0A164U7F3_DAUCS|nr:hypothetical protein DCAR_0729357 [Daucus carota subsp. sativus]